ncbi:MAG TPA: pimeloyl-[acyl-carrier protein] methyl ester esterase, partial [Rudaea sp.]
GVEPALFAQFASGLRADYERAVGRFLALEALGSDQAQTELRELKAHVFERGVPTAAALEEGLRLLERIDLRAEVSSLRAPSLWIAGRRDRLIPAAAMHWAATHAPNATYLEIPSGHAPFFAHAREVADAMIAFSRTACP